MKKLKEKYGQDTIVLSRIPTNRGGLALIATPNNGTFWVRARRVGRRLYPGPCS
jgi:hypothetical protein